MLAYFLEEEGLPTTQISLIRLHTEKIKPPRALWVPFELGRPLGSPNDPAFQRRVLVAALELLEAPAGPVLADFPEDAPSSTNEPIILACPYVPPSEGMDGASETERLCRTFKAEVTSIRPWYDRAKKERGRTIVGVSKLNTEAIVEFLWSFLEGGVPPNPRQDVSLSFELRYAADDLKAYYYEAITALPGADGMTTGALDKWFWQDTLASKVLRRVREACLKSEDETLRNAGGRQIVPARMLR
ncbi:MAG: hypothetical protein HY673_06840 [Chloroflexi bacterium]|nr:hypothetical protein [Chloroflexota bacterium]